MSSSDSNHDSFSDSCTANNYPTNTSETLVTDGGISLEELNKRKNARSSTPRDERPRCPECHSTALQTSTVGRSCKRCNSHFEEPLRPRDDEYPELVPDGGLSREELRSRIWSRSTTPAEERSRCPECRSIAIRYRSDGIYCKECNERHPEALEPYEDEYPEAVTDGGRETVAVSQDITRAPCEECGAVLKLSNDPRHLRLSKTTGGYACDDCADEICDRCDGRGYIWVGGITDGPCPECNGGVDPDDE